MKCDVCGKPINGKVLIWEGQKICPSCQEEIKLMSQIEIFGDELNNPEPPKRKIKKHKI
jgi:hypothetical protein